MVSVIEGYGDCVGATDPSTGVSIPDKWQIIYNVHDNKNKGIAYTVQQYHDFLCFEPAGPPTDVPAFKDPLGNVLVVGQCVSYSSDTTSMLYSITDNLPRLTHPALMQLSYTSAKDCYDQNRLWSISAYNTNSCNNATAGYGYFQYECSADPSPTDGLYSGLFFSDPACKTALPLSSVPDRAIGDFASADGSQCGIAIANPDAAPSLSTRFVEACCASDPEADSCYASGTGGGGAGPDSGIERSCDAQRYHSQAFTDNSCGLAVESQTLDVDLHLAFSYDGVRETCTLAANNAWKFFSDVCCYSSGEHNCYAQGELSTTGGGGGGAGSGTNSSSASSSAASSSPLSKGAVLGISISVVLFFLLCIGVGLVFWLQKEKRRLRAENDKRTQQEGSQQQMQMQMQLGHSIELAEQYGGQSPHFQSPPALPEYTQRLSQGRLSLGGGVPGAAGVPGVVGVVGVAGVGAEQRLSQGRLSLGSLPGATQFNPLQSQPPLYFPPPPLLTHAQAQHQQPPPLH